VLILVVLFLGELLYYLLAGMAVVLLGIAAVQLGVAAVVWAGVATNLALRHVANQFDWRQIDERWIWVVIAGLAAVPMGIGYWLASAPPFHPLLTLFLYFAWVAGYAWAWWSPRWERGLADVLIISTLISAWARFQMWRECNEVRGGTVVDRTEDI
jgi:hypothetical protein